MSTTMIFKRGEVILKEGKKGSSAYILLSGAVEVVKGKGEKEISMATLGEGKVFGEMGLIEDRPRSATVRALSDIKVRRIDRDYFNELLQKKPAVLIPILKTLFERLRQANTLLVERALNTDDGPEGDTTFEITLEGQTVEAKKATNHHKLLITQFPFLIGRHSLNPDTDVFYQNDLFIQEDKPYMVSRNHLALCNQGGAVWVVDRGSAFGTIVNGQEIGGRSGIHRAPLDRLENQVIIGPVVSKFIYLLKVHLL